jgi:transcriptional regulator with XRE-family HTH domain
MDAVKTKPKGLINRPTTGERLRQARKALGLSQEEASELIGVSWAQYGEYERDIRGPLLSVMVRIADAWGLSLDWLTGRKTAGGINAPDAVTFGQRLKEARKARGLSQEELAWRSGVSLATISGWECGYNRPTLVPAILVADVLDVPLDWMTGREGRNVAKIDTSALVRLKDASWSLTRQQYKTLRGQVLAGDPQGALKGLQKILLLNSSNAIKNH